MKWHSILLLILILLASSAAGSAAEYAFLGTDDEGTYYLYGLYADGTKRRLSPYPVEYHIPAWSPCGDRLAFTTLVDGIGAIHVADTQGQTLAIIESRDFRFPVWSPQGDRLAFVSYDNDDYQVYVAAADGNHVFPLTTGDAMHIAPTWSPDGRWIAYHTDAYGSFDIAVAEVDGDQQRQLTHTSGDSLFPAWSPLGDLVAFVAEEDNLVSLRVIDVETQESQDLAKADYSVFVPQWSPDGSHILYEWDWDIHMVALDGSDPVNLSQSSNVEFLAQWSSDGQTVLYTSWGDHRRVIAHDLDGTQTYLTPAAEEYFLASQRPDVTPMQPAAMADGGVHLTHPSGAALRGPEHSFLHDTKVQLDVVDAIPATHPFEQVSPGYEVRGVSRISSRNPVSVDLPAGSAGSEAAVLFYSLGQWIRIPSEPVRLEDGSQGLRVQVDGVPFPWLLTVAAAPDGAGATQLADGDDVFSKTARLEQLRITDQAAFFEAVDEQSDASAAKPTLSPPWLGWLARPASAERSGERQAAAQLLNARLMFLRAYADVRRRGGESSSIASRRYLDGLHYLEDAARTVAALDRDTQQERTFADTAGRDQRLKGFERDNVYGGTMSLRDMTEYNLGMFAPWGLRLTLAILEGENQALLPEFDVRVVPFFGHEPHLDIPLPGDYTGAPGHHQYLPTVEYFQRQVREALHIEAGYEQVTACLRLYSPRIYEYSSHEYYAMFKNSVGGASYLVGLAKLAAGAPVAGTGAAVYTGYSILAPIIERAFVEPQARQLAEAEVASMSTTLTAYSAGKLLGKIVLDPSQASLPGAALDYAGGLTDVVMNYMIDHTEQQELELLRSQGSELGYRNAGAGWFQRDRFYVPPMAFVINVDGPTTLRRQQDSGSYTLSGHGQFSMFVDYQSVSVGNYFNLSDHFVVHEFNRDTERRIGNGIVFAVPEETATLRRDDLLGIPVHQPLGWGPDIDDWAALHHYDEAPCGKLITFRLDEEIVERWVTASEHETIEEWMADVYVELQPLNGGPSYSHQISDSGLVENRLSHLYQPEESHEGQHQFGLAMAETPPDIADPFESVSMYNLGWDSVGPFSEWVWYVAPPIRPRQQFSRRYFVELIQDDTVLGSFEVDYDSLAPPVFKETVEPSGYLRDQPERVLASVTIHPLWEEDYDFQITTPSVEHFSTHSSYVLEVIEPSLSDLSGFTFQWSIVSDRGAAIAVDPEQQGQPVLPIALPFAEEDHPDSSDQSKAMSPFDVDVPRTGYKITVAVHEGGEHVMTVEGTAGVPGPYVIRPHHPGN